MLSVNACAPLRGSVLIAAGQGQSLRSAMCGMSEGLRSPCLQLTPESRAHCVAAEREQRHFHRRNFGFLSIRRAASRARAVFICLCTVGICAAAEARTFQTTSGGCINSNAQRNIKVGEREFLRPPRRITVYCRFGFRWRRRNQAEALTCWQGGSSPGTRR